MEKTMKKISAIIICLVMVCTLIGATPKDDYLALLKKGDYSALATQLDDWYKSDPQNPEVFIGYFNLHLALAMKSGIGLNTTIPNDAKQYMTLTDPKTGKIVGYMHDTIIYEETETAKAISYLDQGLVFGPDRLDIYFGKTHVFMEIHDYTNAVKTIIAAFDRSKINKDTWLWSNNRQIDNGRKFLVENIQDYYNKWFQENTAESIVAVESLAREQIAAFPDHSWAYSNLATALSWQKKSEDPLPYLQKAVEIDPNDMVNVNNLANYYRLQGNIEMAKKYYQIIAEGPDAKYAEYAKKRLAELGNK
jgi:tetratricopeptide (TPR) repeat protein